MVDNPACSGADAGCGEWLPPTIANPEYKGKWYAPKVDNPAYAGEWSPRQVENPDFFVDETVPQGSPGCTAVSHHMHDSLAAKSVYQVSQQTCCCFVLSAACGVQPYALASIGGIGIELWTMQDGILFDNILLTADPTIASGASSHSFLLLQKSDVVCCFVCDQISLQPVSKSVSRMKQRRRRRKRSASSNVARASSAQSSKKHA